MMTVAEVPETRRCASCGSEMQPGETVCKKCKPSSRLPSLIWEGVLVVGKLGAFLGVCGTLYVVVVWWTERNSDTQIMVASADPNHIIVNVRNLGRKPSTLGTPRLLFNVLPGKETTLDFSKATKQAGSSVIQPKASVTISLTTYLPSLIPTSRRAKQYSREQIKAVLDGKALADVPMTLEIEVSESNDPRGGLWLFAKPRQFHVRADHFSADRIGDFIDGSIRP